MKWWKKLIVIFLYVCLFVICTLAFLLLRFPYRTFIQKQITQMASRSGQQIIYQQLTLKFPNRAVFEHLTIKNLKIPAPLNNKAVELERLDLTIIPYIFQKRVAVFFSASGYGGTVSGREIFGWQENTHSLQVSFSNLRLEKYPLLKNDSSLPAIEGQLRGQIEWKSKGAKQMEGQVKLNIEKLLIKGIKIPGLFSEILFSQGQISLDLKDHLLNIEKFLFTGDVFQIETAGKILLTENVNITPLDLPIKVTPVFLQKSNTSPQFFSFSQQPNFFTLYLRGTIQKPSLTPF